MVCPALAEFGPTHHASVLLTATGALYPSAFTAHNRYIELGVLFEASVTDAIFGLSCWIVSATSVPLVAVVWP